MKKLKIKTYWNWLKLKLTPVHKIIDFFDYLKYEIDINWKLKGKL